MRESNIPKRYEFKYILSRVEAMQIEDYLDKLGIEKDSNSKDGFYTVKSIYFDTHLLDDYWNKEAALIKRKKMRARIYKESFDGELGQVWLEIKKKYNMTVHKERVKLSENEWKDFMSGKLIYDFNRGKTLADKEKSILDEFLYFFVKQNYRPHTIVKYKRKAYIDTLDSPIRLTLDKEIEAGRVEDKGKVMIPVARDKVIMEIKFNKLLPWWFKRMIEQFDLNRMDFSKYNIGVDVIRNHYGILIHK